MADEKDPYTIYLKEKNLRDKPLKEAPLTEETLMAFQTVVFELEELEGSYVEDYGKKNYEIKLDKSEWARESLFSTNKPLPGIDPRTGAYGPDIASIGFSNAGDLYLSNGDYDKAIANFNKAIEINPMNIEALYRRGMVRAAIGELKQAVFEDLQDAIDLNPIRLAEKNEQSRKIVERVDYDSREALTETLIDVLNSRGVLFQKMRYYDEAMADFNEVLKYDPDHAQAYTNRGGVHLFFKQYEEAIADCNKAIKRNLNNNTVYHIRGQAYYKLKRYEEAIEDFNKMFSTGFGSAHAYTSRSYCYIMLKDYPKALADANMAVQLASSNPEMYFRRAGIYRDMEEYDKAIADYEETIRLDSQIEYEYEDDGWRESAEYWLGKTIKRRDGLPAN